MARHFAWVLATVVVCAPAAVAAADCDRPVAGEQRRSTDQQRRDDGRRRFVKWWLEPRDRAEIGITDQQSARIEEIFQSTLQQQRDRYRETQKLEPIVAQLIKEGVADPEVVEKQVERLEYLNAEMRKTRIITLYRMHRELTADQRARLKAVSDRRDAEHRKPTDVKDPKPPAADKQP